MRFLDRNSVDGEKLSPRSRRLRRILKLATASNVGYGLYGLGMGIFTGNPALIADSGHNITDGGSHLAHVMTHMHEHSTDLPGEADKKVTRYRIGAASLMLMVATATAVNSILAIDSDEKDINRYALVTEFGAFAISGGLLAGAWLNKDDSDGYRDSFKHLSADAAGSFVATAAIAMTPVSPAAPGIGGVAASLLTAWAGASILRDTHDHT